MHCPKCGQNYPDVFQRFCDTDGTRLVADAAVERPPAEVFARISTQPLSRSATNETFGEIPRIIIGHEERPDPKLRLKDQQTAAMFFDEEPELELDGGEFIIDETPAAKPFGRRIDPHDIPSGHVDLGERESIPAHFNEFNINDPDSFVGKTVKGRYLVTELIGEDGPGFSYLGEDRIVGDRRVVIHILCRYESRDEITKSILDEERVALSHVNHPHVARLFDSGSYSNGATYLISEQIDALTVDDILQIHGRLTAERAARIIKQAAYAVGDVHTERILHRDIHPENIKIEPSETETESVMVTGFGVSSGDPTPGNLAYQAPERLDGRIATVAGDIYSLAVIAYEMLTGIRPFDGESERELRAAQRKGAAPATGLVAGLSPDVDAVFAKALAAEPKSRYITAREFGDAFFAAITKPVPAALSPALPVYADDVKIVETEPVPDALIREVTTEKVVTIRAASRVRGDGLMRARRYDRPPEPKQPGLKFAMIAFTGLLILAAVAWYSL